MDDIIREQLPKDHRSKFIETFLIFAVPAVFSMVLVKTFLVPVIFIFLGPVLYFLSKKIDPQTFDGWVVDEDKIILSKKSRTGLVTKSILFSDIKQLNYFRGSNRAGPKLVLINKESKIRVTLRYGSFELAKTLKYFKDKGVKVVLLISDAELQMYLDGIIEKIPMTNE